MGGAFPLGVHAFFYLWYGEPSTDGVYRHWNHEILPHWTEAVQRRFPHGASTRFRPPGYLHSPYYPARSPYSSRSRATLAAQFTDMATHGISVAAVSWWGRPDVPHTTDTQGVGTDDAIPTVLAAAEEAGVKVAWHLEPYKGRSAASVRADVAYLTKKYGAHPAVFKAAAKPLFYVYDSYHIDDKSWATVLQPSGADSVRGGGDDGWFIALWLDAADGQRIVAGGFDGAYSYFASDGTSYGSSSEHWRACAAWAREHGKLWIPSVGPGYDDTRIRPWNAHSTRQRDGTAYFDSMWRAAVASRPAAVSITSYNEWGEGTQIEAAAPKEVSDAEHAAAMAAGDGGGGGGGGDYQQTLRAIGVGRAYKDYGSNANLFLERTAHWAATLLKTAADEL